MRRIALITQYYPPEPCAAAYRLAAMARAFADAGNAVHVYTAMPSFPDGVVAAPYRGRRHVVERDGAVAVERVWTYAGSTSRPGKRILTWLSVALGIAARLALARERYDLVVVSSPPLTLALPALVAARLRRVPLLVDIRDVFPEIAVRMGAWRAGAPLARVAGRVADALYRSAALVTCTTPSARAEITERGTPASRVVVAANGFDPVEPAREPVAPRRPGVREIVYAGNMGLATGLDVVLDAAARLRDDSALRFVLIGGGADAARLRARVERERLHNVVFRGTLPRAQALRALADAAVAVVPLAPAIEDSLPTKLFDAMLVGTPVVLSAAGEARRLVEAARSGLAVAPGDPDALAAALQRMLDDETLRARCAANGRAYVRENYDRAAVMAGLAARIPALSAR